MSKMLTILCKASELEKKAVRNLVVVHIITSIGSENGNYDPEISHWSLK